MCYGPLIIYFVVLVAGIRIIKQLSKSAEPGSDFIGVIQNAFSADNRVETVFILLEGITFIALSLVIRFEAWEEDLLVLSKPFRLFWLIILGYIGVRIAWWVVRWFRSRDHKAAEGN